LDALGKARFELLEGLPLGERGIQRVQRLLHQIELGQPRHKEGPAAGLLSKGAVGRVGQGQPGAKPGDGLLGVGGGGLDVPGHVRG
jgi:hypothetical protein